MDFYDILFLVETQWRHRGFMAQRHLTKKMIEKLPVTGKTYKVMDTDLKRFGVKVTRAGTKAYFLDYVFEGRRRAITLCKTESMPPTKARKLARKTAAQIAAGSDPLTEREESRRKGITVSDLWKLYVEGYLDHPRPAGRKGHRPLSERTRSGYRWQWEKYLKKSFGKKRVDVVSFEDVERFHSRIGKDRPTLANRLVRTLGSMFSHAERIKARPRKTNPAQGIEPFEEEPRKRFLSSEELQTLGTVLRDAEGREPRQATDAIRLLLLTAARKTEVLSMRWEDLDLERGIWNLKKGKGGSRVVFLNAPSVAVLAGVPRLAGSPWVFPAFRGDSYFVGLPKVWERIRAAAKLDDVRLHDLRHTAASLGLGAGLPLEVLQTLLGHKEARTTERYAHLAASPVQAGAETIGRRMQEALDEKEAGDAAEVIRLPSM